MEIEKALQCTLRDSFGLRPGMEEHHLGDGGGIRPQRQMATVTPREDLDDSYSHTA